MVNDILVQNELFLKKNTVTFIFTKFGLFEVILNKYLKKMQGVAGHFQRWQPWKESLRYLLGN